MFEWDDKKNEKLKKERNISFEEIVKAVASGGLIDVLYKKVAKKAPL